MGLISNIKDEVSSEAKSTFNGVKDAVNGFFKWPKKVKATFDGAGLRAVLRVPEEYVPFDSKQTYSSDIKKPTDPLKPFGGIVFPYTPTISVENKAEYAQQSPLHSNFHQYFYKSSGVGPIQVSGKFTVQDENEGAMLLATIHMLRALTKMRFGADPFAGAPPPICRFSAYGDGMFDNIPVTVSSWRHELPDNVDYITVKNWQGVYGISAVPVLSTITIDLNVIYSRQEMLQYGIPAWLSGNLKGNGFI